MSDEEFMTYLEEKFSEIGLPNLRVVRNGKVRILGFALRRMLQVAGERDRWKAPRYYIGYAKDGLNVDIYDFAWSVPEIQERCHFVAKKKRVTDLKLIGFGKINGKSLLESSYAGNLHKTVIRPEVFYESAYS